MEEFLPASTHKPLDLKNPDDWEYVVDTMEEVMHGTRGTARGAARGASYRMAGKTGTAQVFSLVKQADAEEIRERLRDHALFVGFAPQTIRKSPLPSLSRRRWRQQCRGTGCPRAV